MISHVKETVPGAVGYCASTGFFTIAWLTANVLPLLHILSILAGVGASIATAVYYIRAVQGKRAVKRRRRKPTRAR